ASLRYAKAPLSPRYRRELHQLLGHCCKTPVKYDKRRYKRRNRIEIMFGRLKDWRRVATRYDRCPKVFLSAIALAALVIYWL
ncbi:transposase, partial [Alterinioella nitratireducens]|uniref:transposase n=1 Tax=Alterinioella nitratireducens TaxID=2735915 RepID=UPI001F3A8975